MKLYFSPGASSFAPLILVHELGKKAKLEKVDLREKKLASGKDYRAVNPKGYVPALETKKGEIYTEIPIILQYLADKAGATKLLPKAGSKARYHALEMLNFVAAELHKTYSPMFNPAMPEEGKAAMKQRVALRLSYLNDVLGKQPFVSGKHFGVADCYAYTVLSWSGSVGVDLSAYPNVAKYVELMAKRPSVIAAKKAEATAFEALKKKAEAAARKAETKKAASEKKAETAAA
ncbi:MAG: glutathione transferase GstA [Alphaproteobacteria bacterium]|nr:glutathione transferase GstA [Alphaproteobacteria bacterium]